MSENNLPQEYYDFKNTLREYRETCLSLLFDVVYDELKDEETGLNRTLNWKNYLTVNKASTLLKPYYALGIDATINDTRYTVAPTIKQRGGIRIRYTGVVAQYPLMPVEGLPPRWLPQVKVFTVTPSLIGFDYASTSWTVHSVILRAEQGTFTETPNFSDGQFDFYLVNKCIEQVYEYGTVKGIMISLLSKQDGKYDGEMTDMLWLLTRSDTGEEAIFTASIAYDLKIMMGDDKSPFQAPLFVYLSHDNLPLDKVAFIIHGRVVSPSELFGRDVQVFFTTRSVTFSLSSGALENRAVYLAEYIEPEYREVITRKFITPPQWGE